jgi:hypothetical protein
MAEKVTVKVLKGSISTWQDGSFKEGETFEISKEEALKIDPAFIQIIEPEQQTSTEQQIVPEVMPEPQATVAPEQPPEEVYPKKTRKKDFPHA